MEFCRNHWQQSLWVTKCFCNCIDPAKYSHTSPFQKSQVLSNNNSAPVSFPHHLHDFRDDFSNWHLSDSSVDKKIIIFLDKKELNVSNRKIYIVSRKIVNPFGSWKTTLFWEKTQDKNYLFFKRGKIILNREMVFLYLYCYLQITSFSKLFCCMANCTVIEWNYYYLCLEWAVGCS